MGGEKQARTIVLRKVEEIWKGGTMDLGDDNIPSEAGGR